MIMNEKDKSRMKLTAVDAKTKELLVNNIVKIIFVKHRGYFSERNDFEYTFNLEKELLSVLYKHTTNSNVIYGKYNCEDQFSKDFLENLISRSKLINWNVNMRGPLAYDAASWDIKIYLKPTANITTCFDDDVWRQSRCKMPCSEGDFENSDYIKLRCWGQFDSPMLQTLFGTYFMGYLNGVPENIIIKDKVKFIDNIFEEM